MSKLKEGHVLSRNVPRDPRDLIGAEYNPRQISEKQFKELCDSIRRGDFVDHVVVNKHKGREDILVSGHQRVRAAIEIGLDEIPTIEVDYPPALEKEMNVRFNKNTGTFDFDILANMFDVEELKDWGFEDVELGDFEGLGGEVEVDPGGEIDVDAFDDKMTIKLEYTMQDYEAVRDALGVLGQTPEAAVWNLLGLENE